MPVLTVPDLVLAPPQADPVRNPAAAPLISVLFWTNNDRDTVAHVIEAVGNALAGIPWEAVCVDDDSADGTAPFLRSLQTRWPNVRVIQRLRRRGRSTALLEGMLATSAPILAVVSAGHVHDETLLPQMLDLLREDEADLVIGRRENLPSKGQPWARRRLGQFTSGLSRRLLRQDLAEPSSGFFMLRRATLDSAVRRLSKDGYNLLTDLIASSPKTLRVVELPYSPRSSAFRPEPAEPEALWDLTLLAIDKLVGRWVPPRLVLFGAVGALGAAIHATQVLCLINLLGIPFVWAHLASTILVMGDNFLLNNALTYRDRRLRGSALLRGLVAFYLVCSIGLVGNVGVSALLYGNRYAWWLAACAGIVIGIGWNYAATRYFTWSIDAEFIYTRVFGPRPLRVMINAILRAITPIQITRLGATVVLNPADPVISGALVFNVYENAELDFISRIVQPGMTVLDVGANVGVYTALCGRAVGPSGRIISIEPDPENLIYLNRTIAANGLEHVVVVAAAAANYDGAANLFTSSENRGDNRMYANDSSNGSTPVAVIHTDHLLRDIGVDRLDVIKVDVQGFEPAVIDGLRDTISRSPTLTLVAEFWPEGIRAAGGDPAAFLADLAGLGFALYELTARGIVGMHDPAGLISRLHGRKYTNIIGFRGASPLGWPGSVTAPQPALEFA